MRTLFGDVEADLPGRGGDDDGGAGSAHARHAGPFAAIALENSLDRTLDYAVPARILPHLRPGQRVRVPLGRSNRPAYGYVVSIRPSTTYPRIKELFNIDDDRVLITPRLMDLARWMSRYYVTPLGTVLDGIIPSAVKNKTGIGYNQMVRLIRDRAQVQAMVEKIRAPKRRAILARLLLLEPDGAIEIHRLAGEAGSTAATVRKLMNGGVISITQEMDAAGWQDSARRPTESDSAPAQREIELNDDQRRVMDQLLPHVRQGGFCVSLLYGVTGSGKTEVYLQCLRDVVASGRQAIVLVPEIALTPQTVRRFTARFRHVAILHSGLSATERHRYWQQIAGGHAPIVVGARSAIFAPLPNLGMIVVDEEHESSYKQDTAPRYHGRDVAIKRAQIEGVPVLLGSATPSLETYWRVSTEGSGFRVQGSGTDTEMRQGRQDAPGAERDPVQLFNRTTVQPGTPPLNPEPRALNPPPQLRTPNPYHLLTLPRRVRGLAMPAVELVDMKRESRLRPGIHLLSARLEHLLRTTLEQGQQAILLLNRRGYSSFVYCAHCQEALQCRFCDTTMTYHRMAASPVQGAAIYKGLHSGQLHCHYCLAVMPLPETCPTCHRKLSLFGLGTQRVEEEIRRKFPDLVFARVDSDSMRSARDYEQLLGRFGDGQIRVMLGTQMIAKGLDYPNVTLVGVISGDTALSLPDFRAAERTFQLITQVAGRAGRGDNPGRVVLQTFMPDDPTIRAALRQDFDGFARTELQHRRETALPPFSRLVRIIIRGQDANKLHRHCDELAARLAAAIDSENAACAPDAPDQVRLRGPMPCAISRIAGHFRNQILLSCIRAERLQRVLAAVRRTGELSKPDRVAVDVDPVSLL